MAVRGKCPVHSQFGIEDNNLWLVSHLNFLCCSTGCGMTIIKTEKSETNQAICGKRFITVVWVFSYASEYWTMTGMKNSLETHFKQVLSRNKMILVNSWEMQLRY